MRMTNPLQMGFNGCAPVPANKRPLATWLATAANVSAVISALCLSFTTGCGTCPDLSDRGPLKPKDLAFIRERVAEKKVDLNDAKTCNHVLANRFIFVPLYLGGQGVYSVWDPEKKESCYIYGDISMSGFPLTLWLTTTDRKLSLNGEERRHVDYTGLLAGILGSWGQFHYESQTLTPKKIGGTGIQTGMGFLPAAFYPSRWYFTGTEGTYWNAPMYLFGHVSSDTSGTFHLLNGFIPIRYYNVEKPGSNK